MLEPRWRKALRDLWLHKARTLMVVLASALGLSGAGAILITWALVQEATTSGYRDSLPVSATLQVEPIDAKLLAQVRALPEVASARARRSLRASVQVGGTWRVANLYALDDFRSAQIARLLPEGGTWPPTTGSIAIERSSLEFSGAALGEPISVAIGKRDPSALPVSAIVRDVSLAPGWMEHVVYGFVTEDTLTSLGAPPGFNELQVRVRDAAADRATIRRLAGRIRTLAERDGRRVANVDVPMPGQHIHAAQMNSLLMTQGAFGLLALLVCALLTVNLITAMLAGQVREIGVMKTLGARNGQIASIYLGMALVLGALATVIALPAAIVLGNRYAALKAELLNFPLDGLALPWWSIALLVAVGLLMPVLAAAVPVMRGCRLPVSAALRDHGLSAGNDAQAPRRVIRVGGLGRPLLLSLNNAFRRRQRMALTLVALALGGAVYLGADNLRVAVRGSMDLLFAAQRFDFTLRLSDAQPVATIELAARGVAGIERVEAWSGARASVVQADGTVGNTFTLTAVPPSSAMLAPVIDSGRWLDSTDARALVVGRGLQRDEPQLRPGAEVMLTVEGKTLPWLVVGTIDGGPTPTAYIPRDTLAQLRGDDRAFSVVVATEMRGAASQLDVIRRLRAAFESQRMPVASSQLLSENRRIVEDHLLMVVDFLGVMGWVMIVVGGMGLASTMSLAVLERTREIGVLRAIGAGHRAILVMIQVEGLVIALLSWLLSLPLSVPMSSALANAFGRIMFSVPTHYVPATGGVLRWLGLVVAVSLLACLWPAIRAMRIPTSAALKYA